VNAKERSEEREIPPNSNGRGSSNDVGVTKEPKQNLSIPTPIQIRQGSHKDRVCYDVIYHLKWIPAPLSVYDALQMSKELWKALMQALMDPDDYKDQVDPIEVDEVLSSPLNWCAACMACITFTNQDMQLGSTDHNRPLYVAGIIRDKRINRSFLTMVLQSTFFIKSIKSNGDNT